MKGKRTVSKKNSKNLLIGLLVIVIIVAVVLGVVLSKKNNKKGGGNNNINTVKNNNNSNIGNTIKNNYYQGVEDCNQESHNINTYKDCLVAVSKKTGKSSHTIRTKKNNNKAVENNKTVDNNKAVENNKTVENRTTVENRGGNNAIRFNKKMGNIIENNYYHGVDDCLQETHNANNYRDCLDAVSKRTGKSSHTIRTHRNGN